ncbi:MAG: DHH family phosphoesterase [Tissierellia bacterium]|nr:DHH family phosphoesterase [Tissierellia bacterium]
MLTKALINSTDKWFHSLETAQTIYLSSHVSVDVDNLGSTIALYKILKQMGKDAHILQSDIIPIAYEFLPNISDFEQELLAVPDMYITLDSASLDRIGPHVEIFQKSPIKVVIDHHNSNVGYGDINIIDPNISSTCELLYQICKSYKIEIDEDIATLLFAGISGDTGRFLYSNADEMTYHAAADLVKLNANVKAINENLYQRRSLGKTRILKNVIEHMHLLFNGKLNYSIITRDMLKEAGAYIYELDEAINILRDIDGVEAAFLIKEADDDVYKVSLRSKSYVPVDVISEAFGGGGHKKAAGLTYKGDVNVLVDMLTKAMGEYLC